MKYFFTTLLSLVTLLSYGQTDYNKWSVSAAVGSHDALISSRSQGRIFQLHHYDLNVRYMFNNRVGLMLDGGYDFLDFYNFPRNSHYIRTSIQGVVNVGDIMRFETFTKHIGLLIHGGPGGSILSQKDPATDEYRRDKMMTMTVGITPQVKLNDRWSLKGDITGMIHNKQDYAFDFQRRATDRFINGAMLNFSVGATYYIGKSQTHADWTPTVYGGGNTEKEAAMEKRIADLENQLKDDDADGVPNFRDKEPATKAGVPVDSFGQEIIKEVPVDTDGDGFPDSVDECKDVPGKLNGCPDRDGDAVPDYRDNCPNEYGTIQHNGCALSKTTLDIIKKASESIFFDTGSDKIKQSSFSELDKIAEIMKDNPEVMVGIEGHTDNVGGDEKNLQLSKDRALAVKNYLASKGISASRIRSEGYGSTQPVADNDTEVGRAQNRRVVITSSTFTETMKVEEGK